jgi:2-polyprenyl-3-methyl-5-hydroxy-6-metoxy-1,4-benzoquinol methylase
VETDALAERLFGAALGTIDLLTVELGRRLGLYEALHDHGPLDPPGLAEATGTHPRYAREWLEQQCVSGFVEVDDAEAEPDARRYGLPPEHVAVLVDPTSLTFSTPLARMMTAAAARVPETAEAFRTGGGVPWTAFGPDMRAAQADGNRPWFLGPLGERWLPSVPGLDERLRAGAAVADLGCGEGWASIGIALAYPQVQVDGFDVDEASVVAARGHAGDRGVADRVRFHHVDVSHPTTAHDGRYDLVTAFECVHDLGDPVGFLATARRMLAPGGEVLVVDEAAPERFTGRDDPLERLLYGWSVLICLPDGMSHEGSAGTGTVMRPDVLRGYAEQAGFASVEVLDIEHDLWRFYRLVP